MSQILARTRLDIAQMRHAVSVHPVTSSSRSVQRATTRQSRTLSIILRLYRMGDTFQHVLLGLLALLVVHQVSFRLIFGGPAKYKERVTLRAAHRAFSTAPSSSELLPYKFTWKWDRLLNLYDLKLVRDAPARFQELRKKWGISEEEYTREVTGRWKPMGDTAGLSGSLFFRSESSQYLMKSLGRAFENRFLHEHFLSEFFEHVDNHPDTLLNKILDVLVSFDRRLGEWLNISPSHYLVLENIAPDKQDDWEMLDLKPTKFIEPFRDLLPESVQGSGVTDVLPDDKPILMTEKERETTLQTLKRDLDFLARMGCVDYSILLVRKPDGSARLALIDAFWSLRTPRAQLTKTASDAAGLPTQTVTADGEAYAAECFKMMEKAIGVRGP